MYTKRIGKIAELEKILDKDVYVLCHNRRNDDAYIDGTMIDVLRRMICFAKRRDGAALIIQTPGGSLNESYYIGEFFREYYDYIEAYVVSDCYSGGTMIALSTDKIFLSHSGCLGPIDIQNHVSSKDSNWYPALTGLVESLTKAEKDGKITDLLEKSFKGRMDVLAAYFKESYTYKELVGNNVKKHCEDEKTSEKVWEYLSALNISHGIPLTYSKLRELGLKVNLMSAEVEKIIQSIVRDIEHEFGDLKEKSVLHDYFNSNMIPAASTFNSMITKDSGKNKKSQSSKPIDHKYSSSKVSEKLAVIETPVIGFVQSHEVAITFEDSVPVYMTVISSGWEEEINELAIDSENQEKLSAVMDYLAGIAIDQSGQSWDDISDDKYNVVLNEVYNNMVKVAIDAFEEEGIDADDIPRAELQNKVAHYLINNTELVQFEPEFEEKLVGYATAIGLDYETLGAYDRLQVYEFLYGIAKELMLSTNEISEEEFEKLSDIEQDELIVDYIVNHKLSFSKAENE